MLLFAVLRVRHSLRSMSSTQRSLGSTQRRPGYIKDPMSDAKIAMSKARREKEMQNAANARMFSEVTGSVVKKSLTLKDTRNELADLNEGWQKYEDQIKLLQSKTRDHEREIAKHEEFMRNFDEMIGPFEAKYEECKATVKVSYDFAKVKYKESLQKLIDNFGFNPCYKRWFDEF